ncbi:MAG TPA: NADH-ubiquinone oxidoreductase-F iron-sulfur binding region domain-containing protein [Candidatus Dormibacteraeota bacterium]
MAGPAYEAGYERIEDHERRLRKRPTGGAWLIDVIARSGLRGRGGAWFPTARKWSAAAAGSQGNAVVVINGSEGEPLSAKDKLLLSLRPHLVLDGAALAAESIGATDIILYISRDPRGADKALARALAERRRTGAQEPAITVVRTAHRYIAGESSAVANRASGGQSKPKFSVQRTAEKGVDDRPTLVQNAETLAHVATIARYGSDWFRKLGTEHSPGSTLLTLCGNVKHPGVYEIDLGSPLGAVLDAIGGPASPPPGALIGGYFGMWVPANLIPGLPLDPERLRAERGGSLGCGVVALLPQGACGIVESSRILAYLAAETSGQCGPCVNGLAALSDTMDRIAASNPQSGDAQRVTRWIGMVRGRGACHHPDGAVGQLASALQAFDEHLASHLAGRRCRGVDVPGFPQPPQPGAGWR